MKGLQKTSTEVLGIHDEFEQLLCHPSSADHGSCFVVKIVNYELLSLLLRKHELTTLLKEVEQVVTSTIMQASYPASEDGVMSSGSYVACITPRRADAAATRHIVYLIYHNVQLYISKTCPNISLECKISSMPTSDNIKSDARRLKNLLCGFSQNNSDNYYLELDEHIVERIEHETALLNLFKASLSHRTFSFAYQQVIESSTGEIPYYECLLRIPGKDGSLVSAGPFIQIAEKAGLNNVLDQVVLNMVVDELRFAPDYVNISVNISNAGILDPNLLHTARLLLAKDKNIAQRLIVEITETSLNNDFKKTKVFASAMRSFGCRVALDDFGSGFTSFKQLQNLDIDVIKIDGSFIRGVMDNKRDQDLVKSLIDIARNLGVKTVAEYVENGEIAKFLLDAGIDYMQGNFFSPAVNYRTWIR